MTNFQQFILVVVNLFVLVQNLLRLDMSADNSFLFSDKMRKKCCAIFLALTVIIKLPRAKIFINLQEIDFTKRQTGVPETSARASITLCHNSCQWQSNLNDILDTSSETVVKTLVNNWLAW